MAASISLSCLCISLIDYYMCNYVIELLQVFVMLQMSSCIGESVMCYGNASWFCHANKT